MKNILVIDDEKLCLDTIRIMLTGSGYNVLSALGGSEGLACAETDYKKIDIILLDLMMPDIYGLDVLKALKANDNTKNIPVIIQSGIANDEEFDIAIKLGAASYIRKPFTAKMLKQLLGEYL